MTLTEAVAAWKAENPPEWFPGQDYEAIAADRGQMWLARVTADEANAAEKTRGDQAKTAYDALKAGTATNAQVQKVVAFLLRERFRDLAP
jgi:hypothetical protein